MGFLSPPCLLSHRKRQKREGEKPELNIGTIAIGKFGALTGFRIRCALERRCSFVVPLKASMKGPCLAHGPRAASARGLRPRRRAAVRRSVVGALPTPRRRQQRDGRCSPGAPILRMRFRPRCPLFPLCRPRRSEELTDLRSHPTGCGGSVRKTHVHCFRPASPSQLPFGGRGCFAISVTTSAAQLTWSAKPR